MRINPILMNESKIGVRTFRFNLMILLYTGVLAGVMIATYSFIINRSYEYGVDLSSFSMMYFGLACAQALLLMFIVPIITATTITGERERQTLDILLSTKLSCFKIVIGKLFSSTSKIILLIISTMPIYAMNFVIGGSTFSQILTLNLFFIITTLFAGSIGILMSTIFKYSKSATVASSCIIIFIIVGTLLISMLSIYGDYNRAMMNGTLNNFVTKIPFWLYLNPFMGFISIIMSQIGVIWIIPNYFGNVNFSMIFIINICIQILLTIVFIALASYKLNPIKKKLIKVKK